MERPARFARRRLRCESRRNVAQSYKRKEPVVEQHKRFVGLDVHARKIVVAVADADGSEPKVRGEVGNDADALAELMKRLGPASSLRVCYEAGPCGYGIYRQLRALGIACDVIAPTLMPKRPGDRVKTDKRDAKNLARAHRNGDLVAVWVPDEATEALRVLRRHRDAAKEMERRARQQLSQFLLRSGLHAPPKVNAWTIAHTQWLEGLQLAHVSAQRALRDLIDEVAHQRARVQKLEAELGEALKTAAPELREVIAALQAMRGIAWLTAVTLALEVGCFSRFKSPRELMAWAGMVPSEYSSGEGQQRGRITKAGNAHVRRVCVESAWAHARAPKRGHALHQRRDGLPASVIDIANRGQDRLHARFRRLVARGKSSSRAIVAVGRELLGFVWAIAREVEHRRAAGESLPEAIATSKMTAHPPRRYTLKRAA